MAEKVARNLGGRPRSADRSDLVASLAVKHDAQARRTSRQIDDLKQNHLPADLAAQFLGQERARVRLLVTHAYGSSDLAAELAGLSTVEAVEDLLRRTAFQLLRDLASADDLPAASTRRVRRPLPPSRSLASARARGARLQAELIGLRERCRPAHQGGR
jgi:hypothetical protein